MGENSENVRMKANSAAPNITYNEIGCDAVSV